MRWTILRGALVACRALVAFGAFLTVLTAARACGRFAVVLSFRAGVLLPARFPAARLPADRLAVLRAPACLRPLEADEALRVRGLVEVAFFRLGALRLAM